MKLQLVAEQQGCQGNRQQNHRLGFDIGGEYPWNAGKFLGFQSRSVWLFVIFCLCSGCEYFPCCPDKLLQRIPASVNPQPPLRTNNRLPSLPKPVTDQHQTNPITLNHFNCCLCQRSQTQREEASKYIQYTHDASASSCDALKSNMPTSLTLGHGAHQKPYFMAQI